MKLREIEIKSFKSIEDTVVENIGDIDILSGRNNSGKSAIFGALTILGNFGVFPNIQVADMQPNLFTGHDFRNRIMEITLTFEPENAERLEAVNRYCQESTEEFREELLKSGFLSKVEYNFRSAKGTNKFGLHRIRIIETDGKFGTIAQRKDETPNFSVTPFVSLCKEQKLLTSGTLEKTSTGIQSDIGKQPLLSFPFEMLRNFVLRIYDFSPFRTSARRLPAQETRKLLPDGQNLVQRLFTMKSNEDENWRRLKRFVKTTLPSLGSIEARQLKNDTETHFRDKKWKIEIDLHDMGSGIEQLLMVACVLISSVEGSLILIETPEHHLHPGAQRTLLQFIRENLGTNQVLIATHSPIFLSQKDLDVHVVTITSEGSKVKKVEELDDLSKALSELGSRNSDLLLADSVLFVEGSSDARILKAWAKKIDIDFDSKNIVCITIEGSRNFEYYANSDVLERISSRSPIPYFFLIDRDEKSDDTIEKIRRQVKNILILERREIENYLLLRSHILQAIRTKAKDDKKILDTLQSVTPEDIGNLISREVDKLKTLTLLKRIKEEIGGGTFLPDDKLEILVTESESQEPNVMVEKIYDSVNRTISEKCSKESIKNIVEKQISQIEKIWSEGSLEEKKRIVPGEEVLEKIFAEFGLRYDKIKDGERIAREMKKDEIPNEFREVILGLSDTGKVQ